MAKTMGQGNPNWTREEVALALNLYFSIGEKMPSPTDSEVIELSNFLRSLDIHKNAKKNDKFRNPDGVVFKVGNLRAVATGKGLKNTARMDQEVWDEFGGNKEALKLFCENIRSGIEALKDEAEFHYENDEEEFNEGRVLTKLHRYRERNKNLRKKLIAKRKKDNSVFCDMCGIQPENRLGNMGLWMYECHHIIPISETLRIKTKLSDLSFLCANCHKLIHAAISKEKRWFSINEAVKYLGIRKIT